MIAEHKEAAHLRVLQRRLAEEVTTLVHGKVELDKAIFASNAKFSPTIDEMKQLDDETFFDIFDDKDRAEFTKIDLEEGISMVDALNQKSGFFKSNGDARRALAANSISVNKTKVTEEYQLTTNDLINDKFIVLQSGKKNYFVIRVK